MSSTNKTTNTILSQFIGSDKPSFLTDYNSDMQKIDTAIKSASDLASASDTKATTALSGITDLDSRLDSAETSITLLNPYKEKVDDLEEEIILKAPLLSPVFTGNPTAPTQVLNENSTRLATTQFVISQIGAMAVRKDNSSSPTAVNGDWCGSQSEYDAISVKDSNIMYFIKE